MSKVGSKGSAASFSDLQSEQPSSILGPKRPMPKKIWQHRFVKLLVIGDSGLGKTTLVRCLLSTAGEGLKLHDGSSTTFQEFKKDASKFMSTVEWDDDDGHVHWTYQIQDTPGYGDELNLSTNIERIKKLVMEQNEAWLHCEMDAARGELSRRVDPRVDICLFCLPPHRVRNIDMRFMHEVSKLVPVLPVVTKADTMTTKERINFRADINQRLLHPSRTSDVPINLFRFSDETLAAAGYAEASFASSASMPPPYLVVCSNVANKERLGEGQFWPERNYDWGTCEAFNPEHSDLLLLRRLLLQDGIEEIIKDKIQRYEAWRKSKLCQIKPLRRLASMVGTTALVLGVVIAVGTATGKIEVHKIKRATADTSKAVSESVKGAALVAKDKAIEITDEMRDQIGSVAEQAGQSIQSNTEEAAMKTKEAVDDVREASELLPTPESRKPFWKKLLGQ